jgi:hypothetical protein
MRLNKRRGAACAEEMLYLTTVAVVAKTCLSSTLLFVFVFLSMLLYVAL